METKHTPGPWHVQQDLVCDASGDVYTTSKVICSLDSMQHPPKRYVEHSQTKANANLIAAAPDLLEALREADRLIVVARKYFPKSIQHSDRFQLENVNRAARAAIAKAEGTV